MGLSHKLHVNPGTGSFPLDTVSPSRLPTTPRQRHLSPQRRRVRRERSAGPGLGREGCVQKAARTDPIRMPRSRRSRRHSPRIVHVHGTDRRPRAEVKGLIKRPVWPLLTILALASWAALAQEPGDPSRSIPIGQRYIDTLPKSSYPIPVDGDLFGQGEEATGEYFIEAFPKPSFRVGERCLERLCVIEAHGPTMHPGPMDIVLRDETGAELWRERAWWLRGNQQMRAYWLPVSAAGGGRLEVVQFDEVQI